MITDLATLRAALTAKVVYLESLVQEVKDLRSGAFRRRAANCDAQRIKLLKQVQQVTARRDAHLAREAELRRGLKSHKQKIRKVKGEVMGLRYLCSVVSANVSESEKRRARRSSADTRKNLDSATWRWISRLVSAVKAKDAELIETLCREYANRE